jgi:hypothetical protein
MWVSTSSRTLARALGLGALLLVLALVAGAEAARASVREISSEKCPGGTCIQLSVSCEGLPSRGVQLRHFTRKNSRGTVIFTVGGFGRGRYNKLPLRRQTQEAVSAAGFEVFQVEWLGEDGWGTNVWGAGFKKMLCAYAEVVRWIAEHRAKNPQVMCAQGNSGGTLQNGYGLALYGLEDVLDLVIMSGGPPLTRVDRYCFPDRSGREPVSDAARAKMAATTGRTLVDRVMGWEGTSDLCKRVDLPATEFVQAAQRESLVPPFADEERDFDYPSTRVHFVESVEDPAASQGRIYFDAIQSHKEWHDIPGRVHQADNTEAGSAKIIELIENECRAH